MIESHTEQPDGSWTTKFTPIGLEWINPEFFKGNAAFDVSRFVNIVPPFDNCFFEFSVLHDAIRRTKTLEILPQVAVHLYTEPREQGERFRVIATVFFHYYDVNGKSSCARETVGLIDIDEDGQLLEVKLFSCLPATEDRSLAQNKPHATPITVVLVSLMMLNHGIVQSTLSPEIVKSRQQRRYEERHPERVEEPFVRYYTLSLDTDKMRTEAGTSGEGGWEQAWHMVRGFLRRLPSGKIVPVKAHARGNPLKGIINKDYTLKAPRT